MKTTAIVFLMLLLPFAPHRHKQLKQLYTLAGGTWVMKTKKGFICEHWQKVNEKEMKDQGYKVIGPDTTVVENVQLVEKDSGIYYIPTVKNQNGGLPVPFKLVDVKGSQFTFANPEHDYPQLIVYDFAAPDSIHAWVDGKIDGKPLKIDYYYRRVQ